MTDQTTPETGAQPSADANSIESILSQANKADQEQAETPAPEEDAVEHDSDKKDEGGVNVKKLENAISHQKGQAAKWRHQTQQERARNAALEARIAKIEQGAAPKKDGPPSEKDFQNYADFLEATNNYKIEQKFAEHDTKQQTSQQSAQARAYHDSRVAEIDRQAAEFSKEMPEIENIYNEHAETITDFSPELKRLFLEADNAPLAFYNLAKEGKIEALSSMSLAKAAMEIGRAQTQAITKPRTKAPTPLPASRGSVPAGKPLEKLTAQEAHKLLSNKD